MRFEGGGGRQIPVKGFWWGIIQREGRLSLEVKTVTGGGSGCGVAFPVPRGLGSMNIANLIRAT